VTERNCSPLVLDALQAERRENCSVLVLSFIVRLKKAASAGGRCILFCD